MAVASKQPAIDIIIPTYNGLPYLKEAVDSVLEQTYQNFQLYIIDDGSTDGGATERYVKNLTDKRIHYHRKKNGGQATARNLGIKISNSAYLTFLDSDDLWLPEKLSLQVSLLEEHPEYGMVYGYHTLINDRGQTVGSVHHNQEGYLYHYLLEGNRISGSASMVMVRRQVFNEIGVFRNDFLIGEDWEMWLRVAKYHQIGCVHQYLAQLRALPEGMQKNYLKMARGLDYMLPILVKEFSPNFIGRARLYGSCLWDAMNYYYLGDDYDGAQKAFRRLLIHNPFRLRFEKVYAFMYLRLLLRSKYLRLLRRTLSPFYRRRERQYLNTQQTMVKLDKLAR